MRLVENPGLSIVCIDPGGTTGVAVWDAWDRQLYTDTIDAGMGRQGRAWCQGGDLSPARRAKERELDVPWGKGIDNPHVINAVELGCARIVTTLVRACGPIGVLVCEDFVLWVGAKGQSAKRSGLSPVRLNAHIYHLAETSGLFSGDAWREWGGGWWTGMDDRGVAVLGAGETGAGGSYAGIEPGSVVPPLAVRIAQVRRWQEDGCELGGGSGMRKPALWRGGGWKYELSMPSNMRAAPPDDRMRELEVWTPNKKDANQAMRHLLVYSRKLGVAIHGPRKYIWTLKQERMIGA